MDFPSDVEAGWDLLQSGGSGVRWLELDPDSLEAGRVLTASPAHPHEGLNRVWLGFGNYPCWAMFDEVAFRWGSGLMEQALRKFWPHVMARYADQKELPGGFKVVLLHVKAVGGKVVWRKDVAWQCTLCAKRPAGVDVQLGELERIASCGECFPKAVQLNADLYEFEQVMLDRRNRSGLGVPHGSMESFDGHPLREMMRQEEHSPRGWYVYGNQKGV